MADKELDGIVIQNEGAGVTGQKFPKRPRFCRMHLAFYMLFLGISLAGCQRTVVNTSTPTPFAEELTPTFTLPPEADEATLESPTTVSTTPVKPSPTPVPDTPTPIPDDAYQLTSMRAGKPRWSEDGQTLYFSTIGPDSQRWSIDLATNAVQPAPDIPSPYHRAISRTASLIPEQVSQYHISVSPSGKRIIFPRRVASTGPTEEFCDADYCAPIPANDIWVIDVESKQLTQLRMEGELTTMEVSFLWSEDESRVVIGVDPFWATGSKTPTVWIADLSSELVYPMGARDERIFRKSISPNGDFVTYGLEESVQCSDSCKVHLWNVDSQEEQLLPGLPCCTLHFWLSDNRTIVFTKKMGRRTLFFAYDMTTFEQRTIARSATLPTTGCWYVLAPDERSVAAVPIAAWEPSGIWLIRFDLATDNQ